MDNNFNIVLIGAGYWGTNIAKNLIKLRKKIIVYDVDLVAYNKCRMILLSLSQRVTTGSHAILVG